MNPGATTNASASIVRFASSPPEPTSTIRPSTTPTSRRAAGAPLPSATTPPCSKRSSMRPPLSAWPESGTRNGLFAESEMLYHYKADTPRSGEPTPRGAALIGRRELEPDHVSRNGRRHESGPSRRHHGRRRCRDVRGAQCRLHPPGPIAARERPPSRRPLRHHDGEPPSLL